MKRSTAVRHLVEMAESASERLSLRETEIGWPLEELWVAGGLLGSDDDVEDTAVVLVLDLPAEDLPWLVHDPAATWTGSQLRLGKRPLYWCYRPLVWPAWNAEYRRLVRFWSAESGVDGKVVEALRTREVDDLSVTEPSGDQVVAQLQEELAVSRRHLKAVLDSYWDRDWRRDHKGYDESPEDHLWRAAAGVSEIQEALDKLSA